MKKIIILSLGLMLLISGSFATAIHAENKISFSVMASSITNHDLTSTLQQKKDDSKKHSKKHGSNKHSKKHSKKKNHSKKSHSKKNKDKKNKDKK